MLLYDLVKVYCNVITIGPMFALDLSQVDKPGGAHVHVEGLVGNNQFLVPRRLHLEFVINRLA